MSGKPLIAVENLFSVTQFPNVVVLANEAASGNEAFRVATGRRSALNFWTSTTTNQPAWVKAAGDQVRAADFLALDRGHNLAGFAIELHVSNDDFTTYETALAVTLPAATAPGAVDDALGVRTEEGAWLKRFALRAGKQWRLYVPAMGTGLKPQVVGLYLGCSLALEYFDRPFQDDQDELVGATVESDAGWLGRSRSIQRRAHELEVKLPSFAAYDQVRYHLQGHFGKGRPMWLLHDLDQADRAVLVVRAPGTLGFGFTPGWGWRRGKLGYVEHEAQAA